MTYPTIEHIANIAGYAVPITAFSDEQARTLINIQQRYDVWLEATRALGEMQYGMRRKSIGGRSYLYQIDDRLGNGRSLGRWTDELECRLTEYRVAKAAVQHRQRTSKALLVESGAMARALRLPLFMPTMGAVLREADRRRLLGSRLVVLGAAAMAAYALEAGGILRGASVETGKLALAWIGADIMDGVQTVRDLLTAVDPTFVIDSERPSCARNARGYDIDILFAPSRPEWLVQGKQVSWVLVCRDGSPARIVAPDPRRFALHVLSLADDPARDAGDRSADRRQGQSLLDMIAATMAHFPLDAAFAAQMPRDLADGMVSRILKKMRP